MAERPAQASYDVVCPHCNKPFEAELMTASSSPARGFKCPHCRLFVPLERATGQHLAD